MDENFEHESHQDSYVEYIFELILNYIMFWINVTLYYEKYFILYLL